MSNTETKSRKRYGWSIGIFIPLVWSLVIPNFSSADTTRRENWSRQRGDTLSQSTLKSKRDREGKEPSAQQQANIEKLKTDLQAIRAGSEVTPQQKEQLAQSLKTLAEGTTKPSEASIEQLANDLAAARSDGELSKAEQIKLIQDIQTVLNSANIPMAEVEAAINDAQAILVASGVSKEDAQVIANDLQAIALELKKNVQNFPQQGSNLQGKSTKSTRPQPLRSLRSP